MKSSKVIILILITLLIQSCAILGDKEPDLSFKKHNFGAACIDASNLKVQYDGKIHANKCSDQKVLVANIPTNKVFHAFPTPVNIEWNSANGDEYQYQLDLNEIFAEKQVLSNESALSLKHLKGKGGTILSYREFKDWILPRKPYRNLKIIIFVDNRTLRVLMDTEIKIKHRSIINPSGYYRVSTLAFQKTFKPKTLDLTFQEYKFGVACYNASNLKVARNTMRMTSCTGKLARGKLPRDKKISKSNSSGFRIYSTPLSVSWNSKDGEKHQYQLDLDDIFKERKVLHNENEKDMRIESSYNDLGIIVEVDDRTLNVYMDVDIVFLVKNKYPKNLYSKRNITLAFTKTF